MNIIGPDELVFGVEDLQTAARYLRDYGLSPAASVEGGTRLEALDGTGVVLKSASDKSLPPPTSAKSLLRETIYGVATMRRSRALPPSCGRIARFREAPTVRSRASMIWALRCVSGARSGGPTPQLPDLTNAPGAAPQRPPNQIGARQDMAAVPRTLSHIVLFVPDTAKAEAFYARLGFRTTDRFTGVGPFMRPARLARSSHALHDPDAAVPEGARAFHLPPRQRSRS